ncbi:MAG: HAMP domain-containing histidine kinase, partial [Anaerolineae bacterium]|nr:HAMP domain-containing histidine kinase [Anaerolineae bacterium]
SCEGIVVPVELTRTLLAGAQGELSILVVRDMTAQLAAIREYERLIADLDDFAHVVAHDLQNPLNNIMHSLDMLAEGPENYTPEILQKITAVAVRSTHKAMAIIDELLLLAGVRQAGEVPVAPLDMDLLIQEVLERLQYMIEDADASVILPERWPAAQGYAPWVEEAWANYISNALKYGGDPPVVTLGGEALENGTARFWVHDNGRGVPAVDREKLFRPFSRLERVRARGHGLGLSIVQRIVSRLGGEVDFWNAPESGAVFSFTLPAAEQRSGKASGSVGEN